VRIEKQSFQSRIEISLLLQVQKHSRGYTMPLIKRDEKISVSIEPEMTREQQVSSKLAEHFRTELNKVKEKHAVRGMKT